jgi:hypothetical protein
LGHKVHGRRAAGRGGGLLPGRRTSVPFSLAVASSLPLLLSASAASEELCAEMNLVRRVS